jgi:CRP-like cAMP-binding protein
VVLLDRSHPSRRNGLLAALPPRDLSLLAAHFKDVALPQGAVLQEQGERIEHVYFPHDGIVSLLAIMRQGDAIETVSIGREGAVGAMVGIGSRRAVSRAVVQVAGHASRIAVPRFRKLVEESPAIRETIIRFGESLLIQIQQIAACNALHDVEARLSRWLLQSADRMENETVRLTHEFLSQMLGVRRPTVTVVAHMLQQAGLIRYHRGHIEILDRRGLQERACECYMVIRREIVGLRPAAKG